MQALAGRLGRRPRCDALAVEEMVSWTLRPLHAPAPAAGRDREVAGAIAHLIDLRFDERMTLSELAGAAGVRVFHACRAFRRAIGTSIHRYRQTVRLWHALALLRDTAWPISRIAAEAGFANQGHLTNLFRRRFGATPAQAREDRLPAVHLHAASSQASLPVHHPPQARLTR
jgi:transcriptional regulator GlxA family with amidase domain